MRSTTRRSWTLCTLLLASMATIVTPATAQTRSLDQAAQAPAASSDVRRLSVDDAVSLALEQNLGIQIEQLSPQIEDLAIAQSRASWAPLFSSSLGNSSTDNPATNTFAGGQDKVTNRQFDSAFGLSQLLPTGGDYNISWNNTRSTTTNFFNTFNPQLRSNISFNVAQPLLRNFRIDDVRQRVEIAERVRESADVNLQATITQTVRNVKNAYWDLSFAMNNMAAQRQSLQLAERLLADNERRVQVGTMAPIDIVEAQSEVARNQEAVIVAEAAIRQAEDRLRALIYDPASPDFWTLSIEPTDFAPFVEQAVDVNGAVQRAIENRSDIRQARNGLQQNDVTIRYLQNQSLPDVIAQASYNAIGIGGSRLAPVTDIPVGGAVPDRTVISRQSFASVISDIFGNAYPSWTFALQIGYPIGTSTSEANLARARLQQSQAERQLANLQLQITTEVRDAARQVQTNEQRVASARAARELAERRLEAEEKKFAAGIQTSFFVFQAQRDLAQARTNEVRAISDYNKSLVDLEAVQEVPLTQGR
ncbi:MAG: TolC family protein [Vicinamibacterales bacterium]